MLRITLLLCLFCAVPGHAEEYRTWKDASGEHSSEARFERLDVESRSVCLTTKAGKDTRIAFSKLSTEDQNYVLDADAKRQDAPTIGQLEVVAFGPNVIEIFRKKKFPFPKHREGLLVNEVPNGSPASMGGLRGVDIIHAIDDVSIKTVEDYVWATRGMKIGQSYKVFVERISEEETPSNQSLKPRSSQKPSAKQPGGSVTSKTRWEEQVLTVAPLTRAEVTKAIKNFPPLSLLGGVLENSIGVPVVSIYGKNLSDKAVVAFVVELQCFDRFEKPVLGGLKTNKFPAICQNTIKAKSVFGLGGSDARVTLNEYDTATVVKIYLKKVKFEDGSEWSSEDGVYMDTAKSSK